jgi:hypothetical protein
MECNANVGIMKHIKSNKVMQFDIWMPKHNVAIEFQGKEAYLFFDNYEHNILI